MTRTITVRLADSQYDWLIESSIDNAHGDLSRAVREAIAEAQLFHLVLGAKDPHDELERLLADHYADYDGPTLRDEIDEAGSGD
jgi:hypothetical protein